MDHFGLDDGYPTSQFCSQKKRAGHDTHEKDYRTIHIYKIFYCYRINLKLNYTIALHILADSPLPGGVY